MRGFRMEMSWIPIEPAAARMNTVLRDVLALDDTIAPDLGSRGIIGA